MRLGAVVSPDDQIFDFGNVLVDRSETGSCLLAEVGELRLDLSQPLSTAVNRSECSR